MITDNDKAVKYKRRQKAPESYKEFHSSVDYTVRCGGLKRPLKRRLDQQDALAVGKYFEDKTEDTQEKKELAEGKDKSESEKKEDKSLKFSIRL